MTETLSPENIEAYQYEMIDFVLANPKGALWVEMGLGKTVATLTAVGQLLDCVEVRKILVIAPLRVAKSTWPDEIETWSHTRNTTYSIVCGSEAKRIKALNTDAEVYLINKENVVWLINHLDGAWPFDTVVIDEASAFRSATSKRFKALKKVIHRSIRVVELTGTPAPKDMLGLWAQIFLLDGGERLGKTMTAFKQQYFQPDYMGYNWELRDNAKEHIIAKISDIVLVLKAEDHVQLPFSDHIPAPVVLPPDARAIYNELEKEFIVKLESQDTVVAMNAAVLTGKLRQCSNGALYTDEYGSYSKVHDTKLDELRRIVSRHENEPILVAYNFKSDKARISQRLQHAEYLTDDPGVISRWNRREIPLLLAHPASAGHGLNLQHGGRVIVWFGDTWDLELYLQFNARLARRGQKNSDVLIYHISAQSTVDQVISMTLKTRTVNQNELLQAVANDVNSRLLAA